MNLKELNKEYRKTGYSAADAQVVKKNLNLPTLAEAKRVILKAIATGSLEQLENMGVTPSNLDPQDCLTAFNKSGFSEEDVKMARRKLSFLRGATDLEVKEYLGLKIRNLESGYTSGLELLARKGITPQDDKHDYIKRFRDEGLGKPSLEKAREMFPFLKNSKKSELEAYIGMKLTIAAKNPNDAYFAEVVQDLKSA